MFTGIVEAMGRVLTLQHRDEGTRLRLQVPAGFDDLRRGDSVAINGVCLTVVDTGRSENVLTVEADLSAETLRRSSLGSLREGDEVNLEHALSASGRFGGHFVQGHVDTVGTVERTRPEGDSLWMEVRVPDSLSRYIAEKGSVALEGVSLTVAAVDGATFAVSLIPYTLEATTLGRKEPGDKVNVEVDILAKYVARLILGEREPTKDRAEDRP